MTNLELYAGHCPRWAGLLESVRELQAHRANAGRVMLAEVGNLEIEPLMGWLYEERSRLERLASSKRRRHRKVV